MKTGKSQKSDYREIRKWKANCYSFIHSCPDLSIAAVQFAILCAIGYLATMEGKGAFAKVVQKTLNRTRAKV